MSDPASLCEPVAQNHRAEWPTGLPHLLAWNDVFIPSLFSSIQLSLSETQTQALHSSLEHTGKSLRKDYLPKNLLSQEVILSPSRLCLALSPQPATILGVLHVSPKCALCIQPPSYPHPLSCPIPQVQCLTAQMLFGPTVLSRLSLLLPQSPQEWFCRALCFICLFICLLPAALSPLCSRRSSWRSGTCVFSFFFLLFLHLCIPGAYHRIWLIIHPQ